MNKSTLTIESCEKKTVTDDFSNTSIVHVRNSKLLEKELNHKLITHVTQIPEALKQNWDNIICAYASPYMKYKAYMEIIENNPQARLFFLCADHDVEDSILLRNYVKAKKRPYSFICNNPRSGYRHWILGKNIEGLKLNDWIDEWRTVNLNAIIFNQLPETKKEDLLKKSGIIYFGTFRKHRAEDMASFNGINNYTISSSTKNQDKYREAGIVPTRFIDKLSWTTGSETLRDYKYSIYFEDKHTHDNYACLANRFYECLMLDVLMFFDKKCQNTVNHARLQGHNIDPFFIVENGQELNEKIKLLDQDNEAYFKMLNIQRRNVTVALAERAATLNEIEHFLNLPSTSGELDPQADIYQVLNQIKRTVDEEFPDPESHYSFTDSLSPNNKGIRNSVQTGRLKTEDWKNLKFFVGSSPNMVDKLRNIEYTLRMNGIIFDVAHYGTVREWHLDWSLKKVK